MMKVKRTVFRFVAKRVSNPLMRLGVAPESVALLETTGRRSGHPRQTPVANGLDGSVFWLIAEHGRAADYVKNLLAGPRVRVMASGRWHDGIATTVPHDDALARRDVIERRHGLLGRIDGWVFRAAATDPLTIRIDLDPV